MSAPATWETVVPPLVERLAAGGLCLWSWTTVQRYNAAVDPAYALPSLGRDRTPCLVVGNDRRLWSHLIEDLRERPGARADPVDEYVARKVAVAVAAAPVAVEVRLAPEPPPRRVALQRLAHLAGLGHLGPAHMVLHPRVGPWLALRAALVLDLEPPEIEPDPAPDPCAGCPRPCLPALEEARRATGDDPARDHWQRWLAIRDACPEGRQERYGPRQLRYHYAGDPADLAPEDRDR